MKKPRINPKWEAAEFEERVVVIYGHDMKELQAFRPPTRYDTFEDARDNKNPIYPFEYVHLDCVGTDGGKASVETKPQGFCKPPKE